MACHAGALRVLNGTSDEARLGGKGAGENTSEEKGLSDDAMHI
jgi:hypothetical protein